MARTAAAIRCQRTVVSLFVAAVCAGGLAACDTTIGQARSTQLSLICVVAGGETRASVFQLVGVPSYSGTSAQALPGSIRSWGFQVPRGAGDSWAAWVDPGTSYLATFRHGRITQIDMRRDGTSHANWRC
jgi:hypothetical protein